MPVYWARQNNTLMLVQIDAEYDVFADGAFVKHTIPGNARLCAAVVRAGTTGALIPFVHGTTSWNRLNIDTPLSANELLRLLEMKTLLENTQAPTLASRSHWRTTFGLNMYVFDKAGVSAERVRKVMKWP